ncbi:MAG: hypothetical protein HOK49_02555 [Opitutae bacterium]|nr:hypothetical protein [Opitutae bacterium]MBT6461399.1 hypothetical protein [Opitutae bacterium]MBT6958540.1 hypothetical protein [Opitutae bacterium]MBT7854741.1 hypothetical protein [Opitutae bacterium]
MKWLKFTLALALSIGFAYLGFNLPANFRSVDGRVLASAGKGTQAIQENAQTRLDQDQVGPVRLMREAGLAKFSQEKIDEVTNHQYYYPYTGGPDEHFANFLERIGEKAIGTSLAMLDEESSFSPTIFLLLRESNRQAIEDYLSESESPGITRLLESRGCKGFLLVSPAHPISGAALDMAILATALLIKGNYFTPSLEQWLMEETDLAIRGNDISIQQLKRFYTSVLTLAVYLDWSQLKELIRTYEDWYPLEKTVFLFRNYAGSVAKFKYSSSALKVTGDESEETIEAIVSVEKETSSADYRPLIYTAILFSNNPGGVVNYIEKFQSAAFQDLKTAIKRNDAALALLLDNQLEIYKPPPTLFFMNFAGSFLGKLQIPAFLQFVVDHPILSLILKLIFLTLAGAFLMGDFVTGLGDFNTSRTQPLATRSMNYGLIGIVFALLAVIWVEPTILKGSQPKFDFDVANLFNTVHIEEMTNLANTAVAASDGATNHSATVGIIIGFLLIQLIIFILGLLKLKNIRNENGSTVMKLRLLENEENLFDTGLFVGLAGTVISLILLNVWHLKEASLVAAYASTLFGILFVAVLKIGFVRPYRNQLIREQEMIFEE